MGSANRCYGALTGLAGSAVKATMMLSSLIMFQCPSVLAQQDVGERYGFLSVILISHYVE